VNPRAKTLIATDHLGREVRGRIRIRWVVISVAFALAVALVLLYMWLVVAGGSGPGVLGAGAITGGVGMVGVALAFLGRRPPRRVVLLALVVSIVVGTIAGFLLGRWIAGTITLCVDGFVRSGCGTPWFSDFIRPTDAGRAYAPLGTIVGLATALLLVGSLAFARSRGSAGVAR